MITLTVVLFLCAAFIIYVAVKTSIQYPSVAAPDYFFAGAAAGSFLTGAFILGISIITGAV